jgi:predicted membrane protein
MTMSVNEHTAVPQDGPSRFTPRLVIGLGVLALGLLWTCDNLDLFDAHRILEWWPVFILIAGLAGLMNAASNKILSGVLFLAGLVLLLDNLDIVDIDLGDLFPLFIAVIGGKLVWDALHRKPRRLASATVDPDSELHAFAMLSGVRRQSTTRAFQGGDANAFMGGVEIDLRHAEIRDGEQAVLDVFAMWGGIEITVPETWRVVGKVLPLMGGFEDKTRSSAASGPMLIIRGTVLMGAVEVRN